MIVINLALIDLRTFYTQSYFQPKNVWLGIKKTWPQFFTLSRRLLYFYQLSGFVKYYSRFRNISSSQIGHKLLYTREESRRMLRSKEIFINKLLYTREESRRMARSKEIFIFMYLKSIEISGNIS